MERIKGYVYLLCAFGLAGTSVVAASFVNGKLGTFTITSMGLLFSLVCLLPFCMGQLLRTIRALSARQWLLLFCQAMLGVLLFRMFLLYGLTRTSSVEAGILTGATPAMTVLLAVLFLREKMRAAHLLGVAGTVCGILLIQGVFMPESRFSNEHMVGNILVLGAAGCESLFNVLSRRSGSPKQRETRSYTSCRADDARLRDGMADRPGPLFGGAAFSGSLRNGMARVAGSCLVWSCGDRPGVYLLVCRHPALQSFDRGRLFGHDAVHFPDTLRVAAARTGRMAAVGRGPACHCRHGSDRHGLGIQACKADPEACRLT